MMIMIYNGSVQSELLQNNQYNYEVNPYSQNLDWLNYIALLVHYNMPTLRMSLIFTIMTRLSVWSAFSDCFGLS